MNIKNYDLKIGILYNPETIRLQAGELLKTTKKPFYSEKTQAVYYYEVIKRIGHVIRCYRVDYINGQRVRIFPEDVNAKDFIMGEYVRVVKNG